MGKRFNHDSIRIIRESRNLTREQFAEVLGASRQLVYLWETGKYKPSMEYIMTIANKLDLRSVDIFFIDTDDAVNSPTNSADAERPASVGKPTADRHSRAGRG